MQCSARTLKEMRSETSPKPLDSLEPTPRKPPYLRRAERCGNGIASVQHLFHHGDDLGVSLSSCERTPLTSLFFFQNFNPRSRLRERDSRRVPPRRSSLRGDGLLLLSLSPLATRDTGSGDTSPLCEDLLPGMGGMGGAAGSPSCAEARCVPSSLFGQFPGAANGSSVVARP